MFTKTKLIFNPHSGQGFPLPFLSRYHFGVKQYNLNLTGKPKKVLQVILDALKTAGLLVDAVISDSNAQCEQIARESVQNNYDLVIAAGGDGTVNAVINGLAGSQTCLGLLPMGSMNILANQMNIPRTLSQACHLIAHGSIRQIDLGQVNERYFSCMAGIGFDAYVIRKTDYSLKRIMGAIAYGLSATASFFRYRFKNIHLRSETGAEFIGHTAIIGNVKYYGGDMVLLPAAELTDGKLDMIIFEKKSFFSLLRYGWHLIRGGRGKQPDIHITQITSLEILYARKPNVHLDGDYFGKMPMQIKVAPHALRIIA